LARCVGDTAVFAAEVWGRRPLLLRAHERAGGSSYDDLLSPRDVDELMGPRSLRVPFFRLVKDGTGLPESGYTRAVVAGNRRVADLPDAAKVATAYAEGATIVLQALHRYWPPLAEFCADLAAELGHQVQANAYVTPPGAQGFTAHHDTHDVLVLQVDGDKHWTVREPLVPLPLSEQPSSSLPPGAAAAQPVALDVELGPGDVLYLPRGWLHEAQTAGERSIHLTIGLLQTTWHDVLSDAVALAVDRFPLRAALPLPGRGPDDVEAFRAEVLEWLAGLPATELQRLTDARRARAVPPEPVAPLAQESAVRSLHAGSRVRPRRGLPSSVRIADDRAVLTLPDREVSFPAYVEDALRVALVGAVTPTDLDRHGLDDGDGLVLVRRLLREGALLPVRS